MHVCMHVLLCSLTPSVSFYVSVSSWQFQDICSQERKLETPDSGPHLLSHCWSSVPPKYLLKHHVIHVEEECQNLYRIPERIIKSSRENIWHTQKYLMPHLQQEKESLDRMWENHWKERGFWTQPKTNQVRRLIENSFYCFYIRTREEISSEGSLFSIH